MSSKQDFLEVIKEVSTSFIKNGFVSSQKGQILKKVTSNQLFEIQLRFQPISLDHSNEIQLVCYFTVLCEEVSKWRFKQYRSKDNATPTIFFINIADLLPLQSKGYQWNINTKNKKALIVEIKNKLEEFLPPIIELFEHTEVLLTTLSTKGWRLNPYINPNLLPYPIDLLLCLSDKSYTEQAFNNYLRQENLIDDAKRIYSEMSSKTYKGYIDSLRITDKIFQLAYLNNLRIEG